MGVVASVEQRNLLCTIQMKIEVTGGERVPEQHGCAKRRTWIKDKFPGLVLRLGPMWVFSLAESHESMQVKRPSISTALGIGRATQSER